MTSKLKEKDPKLNQTERMKQIGEMWRTMPLSEREMVSSYTGGRRLTWEQIIKAQVEEDEIQQKKSGKTAGPKVPCLPSS